MRPPTLTEIIRELQRELGVKKRVYPRWVVQRKITKKDANHRLACTEQAIKKLIEVYGEQKELFSE